ncbi:MAG: hypothetical protein P8X82_07605 [Gemmatimonadales bacterium]|jgi:hypothetical protein
MLSWEASIPSIVDQVEEEQDPWEENLDFEEDDEYESDDEDDDYLEDEYEEYEEEFGQDDEPRHGRRPAEWD